ncbi:MAG TPA: hypothetical protein VM432_12535, partial [Bdellovibrionales bacterium]|nr:hypothetical protein [Bdellovibrionales bacterium]
RHRDKKVLLPALLELKAIRMVLESTLKSSFVLTTGQSVDLKTALALIDGELKSLRDRAHSRAGRKRWH